MADFGSLTPPSGDNRPAEPSYPRQILDMVSEMFRSGYNLSPPRPSSFPTMSDVDFARKYDATYGDPMAGYASVDSNVGQVPIGSVPSMYNVGPIPEPSTVQKPMTSTSNDALYSAWLAARRNPVAALGFDPSRLLVSPAQGESSLNIGGFYDPKKDVMWVDENHPTTFVHEALHRGIQQLRGAGSTAVPERMPGNWGEEPSVRAFMQKDYGPDVEAHGHQDEVAAGKRFLEVAPGHFQKMEAEAARLIKERGRKMGPR